jgi:hypothetical protein
MECHEALLFQNVMLEIAAFSILQEAQQTKINYSPVELSPEELFCTCMRNAG